VGLPVTAKLSGREWALLGGLWILELVLCLVDLFYTDHALVSTEERYNARAGMQLLCGHTDRVWELQYTDFCGGCTAEAWLAVPAYATFGGTVLAWKLVPLSFHMAVTALATGLTRWVAGSQAAVACLALFIGAPAFYRSLALTGFGNHTEVGVFPLLAILMVAEAIRRGVASTWSQPLLLVGAGAVSGLGLWFSYTSAFAVPALAIVTGLALGRRALLIGVGLPLGLVPWWRYHSQSTSGTEGSMDRWLQLDLAPLGAMKRWIWSDPVSSLWPAESPGIDQVFWWLLLLSLTAWGLRVLQRDGEGGVLRLWPLLALGGLLGAWWLRHDLWSDNPPVLSYDPFNMRYRAPLIPLLFVGAAASLRMAGDAQRGLRMGLALLVAMGLGDRIGSWEADRRPVLSGVYEPGPEPDRTVPSGEPRQKRHVAQGRPQDLQAAMEFLDSHLDVREECREDHISELGRRAGLALRQDQGELVSEILTARWPELSPRERAALAQGLQRGMETGGSEVSLNAARTGLLHELPDLRLP
jgi:hypothetical protein